MYVHCSVQSLLLHVDRTYFVCSRYICLFVNVLVFSYRRKRSFDRTEFEGVPGSKRALLSDELVELRSEAIVSSVNR